MGQEGQACVGHFRGGGNRYSGTFDKHIVPPSSSTKVTSTRGAHVNIHVSDSVPQLVVDFPSRTTNCHGMDCRGVVRKHGSLDHGRRQHNLRQADAHSARARRRYCLLREGARE